MWGLRILAAVVTVAALGCAKTNPYACTESTQCVLGGEPGVCEPHGFCSFADSECAGGRRFEPNAGDGLGGTCTDMAPPADARIDGPALPDAPLLCGGVGQPCCDQGAACADNGFCQAGTCASCVTELSFGHRFGCYLKYDHTVWCAGQNYDGQLGNGTADGMEIAQPVQVRDATGPITDAVTLGTGYSFACATRAGGSVWCWGGNQQGALGNGTAFPANSSSVAVRVVTSSGPLANIVELGGGYGHMCARDMSGELWCWGRHDGQLGDGTTGMNGRSTAAKVLVSAGGAAFTGATQLIVGGDHTCAMKGTAAFCWGANYDGQLGNGGTGASLVPQAGGQATTIGVGNEHSCWVDADSTVECAGDNRHASIGNGEGGDSNGDEVLDRVDVLAVVGGAPFTGVASIAAGGANSCALMQDGRVMCWGDAKYGQNGSGGPSKTPMPVLRPVATGASVLTAIDKLVGAWTHYCAHSLRGEWLCWGRGASGEFGDNKFASRGFATPLASGVTCP